MPVAELRGHTATVNCISWAPNSSSLLCSGGDDSQVLVWDVQLQSPVSPPHPSPRELQQVPSLAYRASAEICQLSWSSASPSWVAIGFNRTVQALRV